ncbi:MAG: glycogen synthase, partial [Planctomycetes bacterium]|nr:glycogen synthase [Planctomycetota bacterium]
MHIAFLSSEAVPYSKTGGLADVAGALPAALAESGHQVSVFTPYYRSAKKVDPKPKKVAEGAVPVGAELVPWTLYQSSLVKDGAVQYLIGNEPYFDREGLYGTPTGDYQDASRRFIFFNRAVLAAVQALQTPVDVYHANDWQTALIPVLLRLSFSSHPFHAGAATLFTIHNMSYQGLFWHWDWPLMNLPWKHFHWKEMEFYGKINFLKGALIYADILNTVSPTYAEEIQASALGCGLEGVLKDRATDLFGVVNGIDMRAWNPGNDAALPAAFSADNLAGRAACRKTLLERFHLPADGEGAVIGIVSRLIEQKGFDLVAQALEDVLKRDVRLVVLGTGEEKFQAPILRMREVFPERVGVSLAY